MFVYNATSPLAQPSVVLRMSSWELCFVHWYSIIVMCIGTVGAQVQRVGACVVWTHTCTHVYVYIYIYIYIWTRKRTVKRNRVTVLYLTSLSSTVVAYLRCQTPLQKHVVQQCLVVTSHQLTFLYISRRCIQHVYSTKERFVHKEQLGRPTTRFGTINSTPFSPTRSTIPLVRCCTPFTFPGG